MKTATRTAVLSVFLLTVLALPVGTASSVGKPEDVGLSSERLQRVTQMIQRRIAAGDLAGAVIDRGAQGPRRLPQRARRDGSGDKQPMTPAAMFRIASMTKPVVGVGIMMMVEEGKLRLNDPVSRYIPEFRNMKVAVAQPAAGGRGAGARGAASAAAVLHRPGAARDHDQGSADARVGARQRPDGQQRHREGCAQGRRDARALHPAPGRHRARVPAGVALDLQPRRRLRDARPRHRDRLRDAPRPLRPHAHLRSARHEGHHVLADRRADAGVATVYGRSPNGLTKTPTPNDTMSRNVYFRGSGGLYSTAEDYIPLGIMLAGGGELNGKRLLSRKTVEMMRAAHVPDTLPGRPAGEGYGLSVRVVTNHAARGTMLSDGTFGWTGAQGTHFFVDPKEELVGVLMVQTSNGEIQRDFEDLVAQSVAD